MNALNDNDGFKVIAQQLSDAVLMTDAHGYVTWVNAAFETLCGHTLEEMLGCKPGHVLQGKKTDLATARALSEAIIHGQPIQADILNYHKDCSTYWVNTAINPIRDEHNTLKGFIAIERESTQNHHHIAALQEQVIDIYNTLLLSENANCPSLLTTQNLKRLTG
jgi:PAS domain S-box-containing protein